MIPNVNLKIYYKNNQKALLKIANIFIIIILLTASILT